MKKMILGLCVAIAAISFVFANSNNTGNTGSGGKNTPKDSTISPKVVMTTGTSKQVTAKKGQITLTTDSLALYKNSDSLLAANAKDNELIPDGYTLTGKPR